MLISCQNRVLALCKYNKLQCRLGVSGSSRTPPIHAQGTDASYLLPLDERDCAEAEEYDVEAHECRKGNADDFQGV